MLEVEAGLIAGRPPAVRPDPDRGERRGSRAARPTGCSSAGPRRRGSASRRCRSSSAPARRRPTRPIVAQVAGAGLIYLSGGSPTLLAERASRHSTVARHRGGVAGRRGAGRVQRRRDGDGRARAGPAPPDHPGEPGLGLLPHIRVLPHFDRMLGWIPDVLDRPFYRGGDGHLVGIDEDTAIVGGPETFTVAGRQSAWLLRDGDVTSSRRATSSRWLDRPDDPAGGRGHRTPSRSTTNTSVSPGLITPPAPRSP